MHIDFSYSFYDLDVIPGAVFTGDADLRALRNGRFELMGLSIGYNEGRNLVLTSDGSDLWVLVEKALNQYDDETGRLTDAYHKAMRDEASEAAAFREWKMERMRGAI